jgi:hypothetical protein
LKVYNILAVLSLLYGCAIWTLRKSNIRRLNAAEIKMRRTVGGNLLDHRRNGGRVNF